MLARVHGTLAVFAAALCLLATPLAGAVHGVDDDARRLELRLRAASDHIGAASVRIDTEDGMGSGTLVDAEGLVLTAAHVVEGCKRLVVVLADGRAFGARLLGVNGRGDLALLRLQGRPSRLSVAAIGDSEAVTAGAWVVAAGHPYAAFADAKPTLSIGRVRDLDGAIRAGEDKVFRRALVSDVPLSPGSSGGGLFDLDGRLIGVNVAITQSGGSAFSVRIAEFVRDAERLRQGESFDRVSDGPSFGGPDTPYGRSEWFARTFATSEAVLRRRMVAIEVGGGQIAGLLVSPEGDVLSIDFPFAALPLGAVLAARCADGGVGSARLVGRDPDNHVALLRLTSAAPQDHFHLAAAESVAPRGTLVAAIDAGGVSGGMVSSAPRLPPAEMIGAGQSWPKVLQADIRLAARSGGLPVVDLDGELVGLVLQSRLCKEADASAVYGAFVLPTAALATSFARLRAAAIEPAPEVAYFGIGFVADAAKSGGGAVIAVVEDARPAALAGLKRGDRLVSIGGLVIDDAGEAARVIRSLELGRPAALVVERDGRRLERTLPVRARDEAPAVLAER